MENIKPFTIAHINDEIHDKLKQIEDEFEGRLGKRIALVAYEAVEHE